MSRDPLFFEERLYEDQPSRPRDTRTPYQRDRARIMHSAAFRRLQGKTQVMGTGEGDFHRTRLTHSIEVAQIGYGILEVLDHRHATFPPDVRRWLPPRDLLEAACFAHDLGHPPFGHKGEEALHAAMRGSGGFEGNGQTLRILTKLEKYKKRGAGLFPTRRLVLGVLKYPRSMRSFDLSKYLEKPPKSFHEEEEGVVEWALRGFSEADRAQLLQSADGKTAHHILDCSILELADDIAFGVHDIEDIVARGLASEKEIRDGIGAAFAQVGTLGIIDSSAAEICDGLLSSSFERKQTISRLVNLFVSNVEIAEFEPFEHQLLRYNAVLPKEHARLLGALKGLAYELVIRKPKVQHLERRGKMVVARLFETLKSDPERLVPSSSWEDGCQKSSSERRVCDYIAGMTDSYAERLYKRLFVPGFGSSNDEL